MASEPIAIDAKGFVIVRIGPDGEQRLIGDATDNEETAKKTASDFANGEEEGVSFAVYQKIGTARTVRKVEWKGRNG